MLKCYGVMMLLLFPFMATDGFGTGTDVRLSRVGENSDYTTTFYVSGKLVREGNVAQLYPEPTITSIHETEYNRRAHDILPNMAKSLTAICPYLPLVPLMLAPLTYLAPAHAFLVWQILSAAALFASAIMIDNLRQQRSLSTFWLGLLFLPVIHCLFVGQSAILLGLLPLSAGFFLLQKQRPLAAGLVFAVSFLKPQIFLGAIFITLCMLFRKSWKPLAGLISGAAALSTITLAVFGIDTIRRWLVGMQVVDAVYSVGKNGVVQTIVASLPRMTILSTPPELAPIAKPCVFALSAALFALALFAAFKQSKKADNNFVYANYILLLTLSLVPLIAPYLFYYDLSVMVLAWCALKRERSIMLAIISALCVNLYGIMLVVPPLAKVATPWLLLLLYLEMYRRLVLAAFSDSREITASESQELTT